ncbi:AraC family transcriptional regulator [Vallitalea guaymasensis]|uniref:AraC family transcriptional regulator n=1 Tax=Vallitalea guaymasensis TaxID=1185412 RepID=UPI000DE26BC3|nr:AraC family transcriptional regulator [Vallitalea guaymasensis]
MGAFRQEHIVDKDFPFLLFSHEDNITFPPHWHDEIELIYMLDGECEVWLNNTLYKLNKGNLLIIGSREIHHFSNNKKSRKIFIQFNLSLVSNIYNDLNKLKFINPVFESDKISDEHYKMELERQILDLKQEFIQKKPAYKLNLMAGLYRIIAVLLRFTPIEYYSKGEKTKQNQRINLLSRIYKYVEYHYNENISLDQIAKVANFSTYHFTRFFKKSTGITFLSYLHLYRVEKSKNLLESSSKKIIEIAMLSGFDNIKTYNRVFKDYTGMTPSEYRKNIEKIQDSNI